MSSELVSGRGLVDVVLNVAADGKQMCSNVCPATSLAPVPKESNLILPHCRLRLLFGV